MSEEYIDLRPSQAVKGGGMIAEGDYEITDAKFILFDYNGTVSPAQPSLAVEYTNADGATGVQCYSAGDSKNLMPSADGKRLRKVGSTGALNDSCNCFRFMRSIVNAGVSEDALLGDISVITGVKANMIYETVDAREVRGKAVAARQIVVIGKIHSLPAALAAGAPKAAAKASGGAKEKAKPTNGEADTLRPKAIDVLRTVLKEASGRQLEKKAITTAAFKKIPASDDDRSGVLNLLISDGFLKDLADHSVLYDADKSLVMYVGD